MTGGTGGASAGARCMSGDDAGCDASTTGGAVAGSVSGIDVLSLFSGITQSEVLWSGAPGGGMAEAWVQKHGELSGM